MTGDSFKVRLHAWRTARRFTLSQAVAELARPDRGRPSIYLSEWALDHFEQGLTPLPEEKIALEEILARDALPTPEPGSPMVSHAA